MSPGTSRCSMGHPLTTKTQVYACMYAADAFGARGWGRCSYHSGRTFGVGGSTGLRRCTCIGGSCGGSKLHAPERHSLCRGQNRSTLCRSNPPLPGQTPPSPLVHHPPAPLVVLAVAASEVCRAHAKAAQNAGASVVAAAGSRDRTCRLT